MPRVRQVFSLWVIPAALVVGLGLFTIVLGGAYFLRTKATPAVNGYATAAITVISAPTSTPQPVATLLNTVTPGAETPGVAIGGISTGIYVQISGTGGDGLRLRQLPGTSSEVMFMGYE
ncbi:hypothetical protein EG834_04425, partial [bacterium]|nr:hypothetical protein [bacterium]